MSCVNSVLQLFSDAFSKDSALVACDPHNHTCLATALMMRGRLSLSDAQRNITRLKPGLRMAHWNTEVGCCLLLLVIASKRTATVRPSRLWLCQLADEIVAAMRLP